MNQTLNYGENYFRLEIWNQISCLISSMKTAFHRMRKLKESIVHPPFQSVKPKDWVTFNKITRLCLKSENFQLFLKQPTSTKICVQSFKSMVRIPVPLLKWFVEGCNAKLVKFSILDYFPIYLSNEPEKHPLRIHE